MLPTPSTSHVSFDSIYEPAEDSFLFLDTLSSPAESAWLSARFHSSPSPLVAEVGTGSGVVLGFVAANSHHIFGRRDVLALGTDVNRSACQATRETSEKAIQEQQEQTQHDSDSPRSRTPFLAAVMADLGAPVRLGTIDVLLFNPPYVPTEELPVLPEHDDPQLRRDTTSRSEKFERDSYFLSLTYAGGKDGMETTERLLASIPELLDPVRGVAYVLLCRQNQPHEVMERIRGWEGGKGRWCAEAVGNSGKQAGWEKLVIVRIWRGDIT